MSSTVATGVIRTGPVSSQQPSSEAPAGTGGEGQSEGDAAADDDSSGRGRARGTPGPKPRLELVAPEPARVLYEKTQEPSDDSPILYCERAYVVDGLQTDEELASHLLGVLDEIRESWRDRDSSQFVQLASFDHEFDTEPRYPPLATLSWKDWQGRTELWVRGVRRSAAPSRAPELDVPELELPELASAELEAAEPRAEELTAEALRAKAQPAEEAKADGQSAGGLEDGLGAPGAVEANGAVAEPGAGEAPSAAEEAVASALDPAHDGESSLDAVEQSEPPLSEPPASEARKSNPGVRAQTNDAQLDEVPPDEVPPDEVPSDEVPPSGPAPSAQQVQKEPRQGDSGTSWQSPARSGAFPIPVPEEPVPAPPSSQRVPAGEELIGLSFERMNELSYLPDLASGADFLINTLEEFLPCSGIALHLLDHERREFVVFRALGPRAPELLGSRQSAVDSLLGASVQLGRAVRIEGIARTKLWSALGVDAAYGMCAPLQRGRVLGAVELGRTLAEGEFSDGQLKALQFICEQFAEFVAEHPFVPQR